MFSFGSNVMDFGAKGDGITDDTAAIQRAIDTVAERGGGRILFPFTPKGYRIASPGRETYEGKPLRAQLVIPPGKANIYLEGEMPCRQLNAYMVRPLNVAAVFNPTRFGTMPMDNTVLFSDWEAPEEHDPTARPWSILAAPEGTSCAGHFSVSQFSMANLEFRVPLNTEKMYPTQSAVNLQNVGAVWVSDCQFCLNEQVGDALLGKELQPNPCHTVGLMTSGDQNDNNVLRNVAVQGFRYGLVCGEHVVSDYLYIHNCEEGLVFHDCSHLSMFYHIVAQHDTCIVSTTREKLFGHEKGPCHVILHGIDFENGKDTRPIVSRMKYGVYDPEKRLHGSVAWHQPWGDIAFPTVCGEAFAVRKL